MQRVSVVFATPSAYFWNRRQNIQIVPAFLRRSSAPGTQHRTSRVVTRAHNTLKFLTPRSSSARLAVPRRARLVPWNCTSIVWNVECGLKLICAPAGQARLGKWGKIAGRPGDEAVYAVSSTVSIAAKEWSGLRRFCAYGGNFSGSNAIAARFLVAILSRDCSTKLDQYGSMCTRRYNRH